VTVHEGRAGETRLRKIAVIEGRYKLIADLESGVTQLFDLEADPQESKSASGPGAAEALARLLAIAKREDPGPLKGFDPSGRTRGAEPASPEVLEELKALGYAH
jgi:hypothetical protein